MVKNRDLQDTADGRCGRTKCGSYQKACSGAGGRSERTRPLASGQKHAHFPPMGGLR